MITVNNPPQSLEDYFLAAKNSGATFARMQLEKGEQGTLHVQAIIGFKTPVAPPKLRKVFG